MLSEIDAGANIKLTVTTFAETDSVANWQPLASALIGAKTESVLD